MTRTISLSGDYLDAEITRLRAAVLAFDGTVVAGPRGRQIVLADRAGNLGKVPQPAYRPTSPAEPS